MAEEIEDIDEDELMEDVEESDNEELDRKVEDHKKGRGRPRKEVPSQPVDIPQESKPKALPTAQEQPEEQVKIVVVKELLTEPVRETVIEGNKYRFVTIEEALTYLMNK